MLSKSSLFSLNKFISEIKETPLLQKTVDHTLFIKECFENMYVQQLIICPKGYGKTFNLEMLRSFFDIEERDRQLFDKFLIALDTQFCGKEQNKYPVVAISLKNIAGTSFDAFCSQFQVIMQALYQKHQDYLYARFQRKSCFETVDIAGSLNQLVSVLYAEYQKPVLVLIDDIDTPQFSPEDTQTSRKVNELIGRWLHEGLKHSAYVERCVVTQTSSDMHRMNSNPEYFLYFKRMQPAVKTRYKYFFGFSRQQVKIILGPAATEKELAKLKMPGESDRYHPASVMQHDILRPVVWHIPCVIDETLDPVRWHAFPR